MSECRLSCSKCGEVKPESEFYKNSSKSRGRQAWCISCENNRRLRKCHGCGQHWMPRGSKAAYCPRCYPYFRQASKLVGAAKYRAEQECLEFDLDKEWVAYKLMAGCPKTGVQFEILRKSDGISNRAPFTPSIDKIDPTKGYTKDNVQVVCWWYNAAKQRFTDSEVLTLCLLVTEKAGFKHTYHAPADHPQMPTQ